MPNLNNLNSTISIMGRIFKKHRLKNKELLKYSKGRE
jgi:hypothetical protein